MSIVQVKAALKRFADDESGISAVEYGLLAAGIALVVFAAASQVGTGISTIFGNVATNLTTPGGSD
ncbi:Flp family type IVb pilin [Parvibaculum sp.]|uniref:Flp family type IVb pilin n=1 Tax=Parvibaculum sp. TaxID=2024848 RepID=UPI002CBB6502|nr:Flp family type IVb pilin [Parvibaculum sp.]HUD51769.1 Flp family type IVb pilin [Parvibaculum sp.]